MHQQPERPFDLDAELRKLQEIKQMREQQIIDKRNQALKKKQDEINKIFFKKELRSMKDKQYLAQDKYSFYHNETVRKEEQAINQQQQASSSSQVTDQFKIDNISFFLAEEHKNHRVDNMDWFMNSLFRLVAFGSFGIIFGIVYLHIA